MANIFQRIPVKVPRSTNFNKTHEYQTTTNFGSLVPVFCEYLNPGDKYTITPEVLCRMAPMVAPVFSRVYLYIHFFAVPLRLIDYKFQKVFINDQNRDGAYSRPYVNPSKFMAKYGGDVGRYFTVGSLWDYFGFNIPTSSQQHNIDVLSDCFRAYQLIWNEYYRDQNLQTAVALDPTFNGDECLNHGQTTQDDESYDPRELLKLRYRCFEKDYFTSALPFTQRGEPVTIPLSGDANIYYDASTSIQQKVRYTSGSHSNLPGLNGSTQDQDKFSALGSSNAGVLMQNDMDDDSGGISRLSTNVANIDLNGSHKVDLSGVNASTINELRFAFALQSWLEANARAGARYKEQLMVHFGVVGKDARLDRPEFLGGVKTPLAISEVLATAQTNEAVGDIAAVNVGDMAGHGRAVAMKNCVRNYFADEHCLIIGIMSVMPRTSYSQGIRRQFSAFDFYDYPFPKFAHLGEQAIRNKELYVTGTDTDNGVFGYQSRYSEYKYIPSRITGQFRADLRYWNLSRFFDNQPQLNGQFVSLTPADLESFNRIFSVQDPNEHHFYVYILHRVHSRQELPRFGVPSL